MKHRLAEDSGPKQALIAPQEGARRMGLTQTRRLSILLLAMLAASGARCTPGTEGGAIDLREAVLSNEWPPMKARQFLESGATPSCEDALWLIERLSDSNPLVRNNAALALSGSRLPAAASAVYLALISEQDGVAYDAMLGALGRMGSAGKPFLVRVLEQRGLSPALIAALAQSSGVKPSRRRSTMPFVTPPEGAHWWSEAGKAELGDFVPQHPAKAHPQSFGVPGFGADSRSGKQGAGQP